MAKKQNPEDYIAIKDLMKEQLAVLEEQEAKAESINKVFKDLGTNLFGASNYQKEIVEDLNKAKNIAEEQKVIDNHVLEILTKKKYLSTDIKKDLLESLDKHKIRLDLEQKATQALKDQQDLAKTLADSTDGFIDSIETKVKGLPFLGDFLAKSMGFDELRTQFKEDVINSYKDGFKGMTTSVVGFGKSLLTALAPLAPLLITLAAIKLAFDFDKEVTELSRNLGVSRDTAKEMHFEFEEISKSTEEMSVTTKGLVTAQKELSAATGMSAMFSEDMLTTQIKLVKFMGMTGTEAAKLSVYSESIGMNARDLQLEVVGVVHQFNEATGASVNLNDVLKDINDLSASMKSHFKGNVEEMAKAVTLARSMGISLTESAAAAESTLSISSSIKKEMTAMMIAGVSINNNAVRQAQLAGDHKEVLRLQKEQLLEMGDLSKKSPMQQQAIADAMGFSVDKLVEMNEQSQLSKKLGMDISKATLDQIENSTTLTDKEKEKILQERESLSNQEKMANIVERIQKIFVKVGDAIFNALDALSPLSFIFDGLLLTIQGIATFIGYFVEGIKTITMLMSPLIALWAALNIKAIAGAVAAAARLAFSTAGVGIPFAIAGLGAASVAIKSLTVGDVMSPADGKTRVSTKEGGLYELSPNDDLAAAPGLLDKPGGGIDLSGLINEIKGLRRDIQTQPIQVTVDGRVVSEISRVQRQQNSVRTTGYGR
jgi:hypothetical protein